MDKSLLLNMLRGESSSPAVLIVGPKGAGLRECALSAAAAYLFGDEHRTEELKDHADFRELSVRIKAEYFREELGKAHSESFYGGRRAFLIQNLHLANETKQNAFLKLIEMPPPNTLFLFTGSISGVLPTIISRCSIVHLGAEDPSEVQRMLEEEGIPKDRARRCCAWADGIRQLAKAYADPEYEAFRTAAADCLKEAVFGALPFARSAELLKSEFVLDDPDSEEQQWIISDKEIDLKKTGKGSAAYAAGLALDVWLSLLRDALCIQMGAETLQNPDRTEFVTKLAGTFTTRGLQGMIKRIAEAKGMLQQNVSAKNALDGVLAAAMKKE